MITQDEKKIISIVLPVYNEEKSIIELYGRLRNVEGRELAYVFEYIFVNDGSKDGSIFLLSEMAKENANVKVINFSRNFGHQMALTAGYDFARGAAIITMDSDLQDPPEIISSFLREWEANNKIVYARRIKREDGILKRITAHVYYKLLEMSSDFDLPRNVGDFRLIDKVVLGDIKKCREKFRYLRGMVAWTGYKYSCVDFERPNRLYGKSAYTWKKMIKFGFDGFTGFSMFPLKLAAFFGLFIVFTSMFLFFLGIVDYFIFGNVHDLYKWLINVIYGFTGVQFLLIWLLGEYIGRIHDQVKNRPLYVVDKKININ